MSSETGSARERLRRRYRPDEMKILFVGEAPPASGRFFYQADSGLYRAIRQTFVAAFPLLEDAEFLESFRDLGCYLVDLCGMPVDRMTAVERRSACVAGEVRLGRTIRRLRPKIMITVVRSITTNVARARVRAGWTGVHFELPYPGRWHAYRIAFERALVPVLRREFGKRVKLLRVKAG